MTAICIYTKTRSFASPKTRRAALGLWFDHIIFGVDAFRMPWGGRCRWTEIADNARFAVLSRRADVRAVGRSSHDLIVHLFFPFSVRFLVMVIALDAFSRDCAWTRAAALGQRRVILIAQSMDPVRARGRVEDRRELDRLD